MPSPSWSAYVFPLRLRSHEKGSETRLNGYKKLDISLVRPQRMDMWVRGYRQIRDGNYQAYEGGCRDHQPGFRFRAAMSACSPVTRASTM